MWDITKAVFSGYFTLLNINIRKEEMSQINNLIFHLKKVVKKSKAN